MAKSKDKFDVVVDCISFCKKHLIEPGSVSCLEDFLNFKKVTFANTLIKPASSSGKYHPPFDRGALGTFNHTCAVTRVAEDLMRADPNERWVKKYHDTVIFACAVHDLGKYGIFGTEENTVFDHPETIAAILTAFKSEYKIRYKGVYLNKVIHAVKRHMGKWTTSKYSNKVLKAPKTKLDKVVHLADYIASREYISRTVLK